MAGGRDCGGRKREDGREIAGGKEGWREKEREMKGGTWKRDRKMRKMWEREGMRERWREEDGERGGVREMKGGRERGHAVATHFAIQRSCSYYSLHHPQRSCSYHSLYHPEVMQLPLTLPSRGHAVTTLFTTHRGFLTGKFKRGQLPAEGRLAWSAKKDKFKLEAAPAWSVLDTDSNWTILDTAEKIAKARGSCQHRGIIIIVIGNL